MFRTVSLNEEAFEVLKKLKIETKSKSYSDAIIAQSKRAMSKEDLDTLIDSKVEAAISKRTSY